MKNQRKHYTPEEKVAVENHIVDFVRCWPEWTEIGVGGSSSGGGAEAISDSSSAGRLTQRSR
jgi:hypothetical protein